MICKIISNFLGVNFFLDSHGISHPYWPDPENLNIVLISKPKLNNTTSRRGFQKWSEIQFIGYYNPKERRLAREDQDLNPPP